jgi:hypothetical protein
MLEGSEVQLQQIIHRRAILQEDRAKSIVSHAAFLKATDSELAQLADAETLIVGGIDYERLDRARTIISVQGEVTKTVLSSPHGGERYGHGVRATALAEAKADLANGGDKIGRCYFGVKNYDGFGDQRNDSEYGMGPRHGSIVFSIGLTPALRQRVRTGPALEDHEIEDALYLLSSLPKIEQLRAEQKVAA